MCESVVKDVKMLVAVLSYHDRYQQLNEVKCECVTMIHMQCNYNHKCNVQFEKNMWSTFLFTMTVIVDHLIGNDNNFP